MQKDLGQVKARLASFEEGGVEAELEVTTDSCHIYKKPLSLKPESVTLSLNLIDCRSLARRSLPSFMN